MKCDGERREKKREKEGERKEGRQAGERRWLQGVKVLTRRDLFYEEVIKDGRGEGGGIMEKGEWMKE